MSDAGDLYWSDELDSVRAAIAKATGERTVDQEWAKQIGLPLEIYPADWDRYGKSAGHRRNAEMAAVADALIALWDGQSRGTKGMIDLATAKGLRVFVRVGEVVE